MIMTRYTRPLVALLLLSMLAPACKKENKIPVISVTPTAPDIDVVSGVVLSFSINAQTDNSTLASIVITSKKGNGFTVTLRDSTISGTSFNWNWEYLVANATEAYTELLTFRLTDVDGTMMETQRTLYVTLGATVLTETSGHTFYSGNSIVHPESAFDLQERIPVLSTVDSTRRDVQDNPLNGTTTELSRNWISPAGGRLVRFNGYDYANATDISLRSAYETGIPVEELSGIAVSDIILIKLGSLPSNTSFYAALRVVDIVDDGGTSDNDRYIFNMKWTVFVE